jgi:hypothetical protein
MAKSTKRATSQKVGTTLVRAQQIEHQILVLRGHKVLLDSHLAAAYCVLNQAVKWNAERFPKAWPRVW